MSTPPPPPPPGALPLSNNNSKISPPPPSGGPPPPSAPIHCNKPTKKLLENRIEWNKVTSVRSSDAGCVFIVEVMTNDETKETETVVVKGTTTVVQEIFANLLYKELKINSPRFKIIQFTEGNQFYYMQRVLEERVAKSGGSKFKVQREINRPFIIVMEYFENIQDFYQMHPQLISEANYKSIINSPELLFEICKIIVADVIINNWDRLPIIWDNDGNAGNLLFQFTKTNSNIDPKRVKILAIDQAITPITNEKQYKMYQNKIIKLVEDLISPKHTEGSPSSKYRSFIEMIHQVDIGEEGLDNFKIAMIKATLHILDVLQYSESDQAKEEEEKRREGKEGGAEGVFNSKLSNIIIENVYKKVESICISDWEKVFETGLKSVHIPFILSNLSTINRYRDQLFSSLYSLEDKKLYSKYNLSIKMQPQISLIQNGNHSPYLKVTCVQISSIDALDAVNYVHHFFANERKEIYPEKGGNRNIDQEFDLNDYRSDHYHQCTNIIVFPELGISYHMERRQKEFSFDHRTIKMFKEVSNQYNCLIVWGSSIESTVDSSVAYNTSLITGPNDFVQYYRQQRLVMTHLTPGEKIGIWDTPVGRIAVLICFDIENEVILDEVLQLKPDFILNPVYINSPSISGEFIRHSSRINAIDEMSHKFEAIMRDHNITLIRADVAHGLGSSQIISPFATFTAPSSRKCFFSLLIPKNRFVSSNSLLQFNNENNNNNNNNFNSNNNNIVVVDKEDENNKKEEVIERKGFEEFERVCKQPTAMRSAKRDNTGNRYLVRSMKAEEVHPFSQISLSNQLLMTSSKRFVKVLNAANHFALKAIPLSGKKEIGKTILLCENFEVASPSSLSSPSFGFISFEDNTWSYLDFVEKKIVKKSSFVNPDHPFDHIPFLSNQLIALKNDLNVILSAEKSGFVQSIDLRSDQSKYWKISDSSIETISQYREFEFICGTINGDLIFFDIRYQTPFLTLDRLLDDKITSLIVDEENNVVVTSVNGTIKRFNIDKIIANRDQDLKQFICSYQFVDPFQNLNSSFTPFALNSIVHLENTSVDHSKYLIAVNNRIHLIELSIVSPNEVKQIDSKYCFHSLHQSDILQLSYNRNQLISFDNYILSTWMYSQNRAYRPWHSAFV